MDTVITQGRCWGKHTRGRVGPCGDALAAPGWVRRCLLWRPCGWAMWGSRNSPAGGRGPEEGRPGVGAAQAKGQRQAEQSPCLEAKMLTAHPGPSRSPGACPGGPAVRSCVTRSWPQVPRGKHRSTALSQGEGAMAGTYPASWPLKWLQLLRGVSSAFPEVPGWNGALFGRHPVPTLTSHMHC